MSKPTLSPELAEQLEASIKIGVKMATLPTRPLGLPQSKLAEMSLKENFEIILALALKEERTKVIEEIRMSLLLATVKEIPLPNGNTFLIEMSNDFLEKLKGDK